MPTSINGNVRLTYGNHNHNENFTSKSSGYSRTNTTSQYAAGGARAVYAAASVDTGTMGSNDPQGLLMIKNVNTSGSLFVSLDGGSNWDIKIPAGFVNLISFTGITTAFELIGLKLLIPPLMNCNSLITSKILFPLFKALEIFLNLNFP